MSTLQNKLVVFLLIFVFLGLPALQKSFAYTSRYSLSGIEIDNMQYDGIKANISYANPTLMSHNNFSGENISLADNNDSWVEVG